MAKNGREKVSPDAKTLLKALLALLVNTGFYWLAFASTGLHWFLLASFGFHWLLLQVIGSNGTNV